MLQQGNPCNHQSQPLQDKHANAGTVFNEKQNIVIFGDSIPKGINRKVFGQKLFNPNFFIDSSLASLQEIFFNYIKPNLQDPQTNFGIPVSQVLMIS